MLDVFQQVVSNLRANKLRSFLTMFGILWGVVSVIVLSATGEGFRRGNQHVLEEHANSLIIPEAAIVYDADKRAFVEVPAPGEDTGRKRVAVKLGIGNGTRTQVIDGLKAGDRVVLPG